MGMRGVRVAGVALLVLAAGGCGGEEFGATADEPADPHTGPVTVVDGEVLISCFGSQPGWPASAMVDGIDGPTPRAEIEDALDAVAVHPELSVETSRVLPQGGRTPWKLLVDDGEHLTIALGGWGAEGPDRSAMTMTLERGAGDGTDVGDGWRWTGHGSCAQLAPVLDEQASWVQVNASQPVDGGTTEVAVDVNEVACTSARDPEPFLDEPVLVSTEESVTVYWTSEPPGAANCPSNPTSRQVLVLPEPLGDRPLLDGSRWPPVLIGQDESAR